MGTTGTRQQGETTLPPTPSPAFPTAPAQACNITNVQPAPNLAQMQRTCNTMAKVAATAPDPKHSRVPGNLHPTRRWGQHDPLIASREARNLAAEGEATICGVP